MLPYAASRKRREQWTWNSAGLLGEPAVAETYANPVPFVADASLAGLAGRAALFAVDAAATAVSQAATYPQSVASGDPTHTE